MEMETIKGNQGNQGTQGHLLHALIQVDLPPLNLGWRSDATDAIRCNQIQSDAPIVLPHLEFGNGCDDATGRDAEDEVACGV